MSSRPASERFTAWLAGDELGGVLELAAELESSKNYVVRMMIRACLGMAVSPWLVKRLAANPQVVERVLAIERAAA